MDVLFEHMFVGMWKTGRGVAPLYDILTRDKEELASLRPKS